MKFFKMNKFTGMLLVFGFIFSALSAYLLTNSRDTFEEIEVDPQNTLIKIFKKKEY